tara:strand:+ start:357 stop:608 length:252 start_codon:yes stop_codon:yes gene_type:complete
MNAIQKYNKETNKEINDMITIASHIFTFVSTSPHDGVYLQVQKSQLRFQIEQYPEAFDIRRFELRPCLIGGRTSRALYIGEYA